MVNTNYNRDAYLYLNTDCKQIVMIENKNHQGGILYSEKGAAALSPDAFQILYKAFISPINYPIQSLVTNDADMIWLNDLLKNDLFLLSSEKPCKNTISKYTVEKQKEISLCFSPKPMVLIPSQEVTESLFEDIIIYYTLSLEEIPIKIQLNNATSAFLYTDDSSQLYPGININNYANSVYLHPIADSNNSLATSCTSCQQCYDCVFCGMCSILIFVLAILGSTSHSCAGSATSCPGYH